MAHAARASFFYSLNSEGSTGLPNLPGCWGRHWKVPPPPQSMPRNNVIIVIALLPFPSPRLLRGHRQCSSGWGIAGSLKTTAVGQEDLWAIRAPMQAIRMPAGGIFPDLSQAGRLACIIHLYGASSRYCVVRDRIRLTVSLWLFLMTVLPNYGSCAIISQMKITSQVSIAGTHQYSIAKVSPESNSI